MPRQVIGDWIRRKVIPPKASTNVSVGWSWSNESQGLVEWAFKNNSSEQVAFVLYRSGYYFCGAFGASIYVSNPGFGVSYAPAVAPLTDYGAQANAPPLGIVNFPGGLSVVCFVFVLAPGTSYSQIEGGFSSLIPPDAAAIYELSNPVPGTYCIGYDPASVTQWNAQSGENLTAYSPNPSAFQAVAWTPPTDAPIAVEFPVSVSTGDCSSTSSPSPPAPPTCVQLLDEAAVELEAGNVLSSVEDVIAFLMCEIDSGAVSMSHVLKAVVEEARKRR